MPVTITTGRNSFFFSAASDIKDVCSAFTSNAPLIPSFFRSRRYRHKNESTKLPTPTNDHVFPAPFDELLNRIDADHH